MDRYAVVGNPIAHSKSPLIHGLFAQQTNQAIEYTAQLGDPVGFESQVLEWFATGLCGLNVTLPFKERALSLAVFQTDRARQAGAANTLRLSSDGTGLEADNTDGVGLMRDLNNQLQIDLEGKRVLVMGAGGATRGILGPIMAAKPERLALTNRTESKGLALVQAMQKEGLGAPLVFFTQDNLAKETRPFDVVINATSSSITGGIPFMPDTIWGPHTMAYDLAYSPTGDTPFLAHARAHGVQHSADGLGMLVEQAAEAFHWWRGVVPDTKTVLRVVRKTLAAQ